MNWPHTATLTERKSPLQDKPSFANDNLSDQDDLMEQIENKADELIRMFGGSGIRIKTTDDLPDGFKKGLH